MAACGDTDFGYQTVKNSIRQVWNNTYVAPGDFYSLFFKQYKTEQNIYFISDLKFITAFVSLESYASV